MPRSIVAVVAGLLSTLLLLVVGAWVAVAVTGVGPDGPPTSAYLALKLAVGAFAPLVGGFVAARICAQAWLAHAGILAALVVALAIAGGAPPGQPEWYPYALAGLGLVGALLGGWIGWRSHARTPPPPHMAALVG